jgi:hypothetical protein
MHTYICSETLNRKQVDRRQLLGLLTINKNLRGLSPQANYTDRATVACQPSWSELLLIEDVAWPARRIPAAVSSVI